MDVVVSAEFVVVVSCDEVMVVVMVEGCVVSLVEEAEQANSAHVEELVSTVEDILVDSPEPR